MASELPVYEYEVNGVPHTAQLDEDDAERYGAVRSTAQAPKAKARPAAPQNKAAQTAQTKV